jgi:hypothetical protein
MASSRDATGEDFVVLSGLIEGRFGDVGSVRRDTAAMIVASGGEARSKKLIYPDTSAGFRQAMRATLVSQDC